MRQMHGPCIAQADIMALANMTGGAQADRRHPCRDRRFNSARAVLDHETRIRVDAQFFGGKQENIGMRLAARDHVGAEDVAAELRFQLQNRKTKF